MAWTPPERKNWNELTPEYQNAIKACYPSYRGRKFRVSLNVPSRLDSYWDGGSRDYFCFYNTLTRQALPVHSNHPWYEPNQPRALQNMPPHVLLVQHSIFCGKDSGITVYATTTPVIEAPALTA